MYCTRTGNTRFLAEGIAGFFDQSPPVLFSDLDLPSAPDFLFLGTHTAGNGRIPRELKEWVLGNPDFWQGKEVVLFGSGNSTYPKFCGALDGLSTILTAHGARVCDILRFEHSILGVEELQLCKKILLVSRTSVKGRQR